MAPRLIDLTRLIFAILPLAHTVRADAQLDASRTGSWYTDIPIYRSGSGTNYVRVKVGTPGVDMQLTISTSNNFVQVVSDRCSACVTANELYDPAGSSTWTSSDQDQVNIVVFPQVPEDTLTLTSRLGTDILLDPRGEDQVTYPISVVDRVEAGRDGAGGGTGSDARLGRGVTGFYGLGVNQQDRQQSIIANMLNANNYPPNQPVPTSFIVGFNIGDHSGQIGAQVGSMHWGAVPQGKWVGDFNWIESNRTVAGSWGFPIDNIRMGGNVVDTSQLYASIDPGFDGIYVPTRIAEQLFNGVQGVRRDANDPRQWTIPCNFIQSMSISIRSATYNLNPTQLVDPIDAQARSCYSQVQAWTNGSVAEEQGEIRLGTSFMSGIYPVIYYSPNQQFVGFAGKPGTVNDANVAAQGGRGMPNRQLAGILIGTLLAVLLILFVICYARNRSTVQSIWSRGMRRAHRAQMNAVIRSTTIPPPMAVVPPPHMQMMGVHPGMMGMGLPPGAHPGMMGPMGPMPMGPMGPRAMGPRGMIPPGGYAAMMAQQPQHYQQLPQYQGLAPPIQVQHQNPQQQQQHKSRHRSLPAAPAPAPDAYHSPGNKRSSQASPPSTDTTIISAANGRKRRERHSAPVPPRKPTNRDGDQAKEAGRGHKWSSGQGSYGDQYTGQVRNATSEAAGYRHHGGSSGRDVRVKRWSRNVPPSRIGEFAEHDGGVLHSHPEESAPSSESRGEQAHGYNGKVTPAVVPALYDPARPDHTMRHLSQPEYDHAPPASATGRSLWNFGKPKAKSVARGYEAVPRHTSTKFEYSGGDVPYYSAEPALVPAKRSSWFGGDGAGGPKWTKRNKRREEVEGVQEEKADWKDVETNREREGLAGVHEWRR